MRGWDWGRAVTPRVEGRGSWIGQCTTQIQQGRYTEGEAEKEAGQTKQKKGGEGGNKTTKTTKRRGAEPTEQAPEKGAGGGNHNKRREGEGEGGDRRVRP